MLRATARSPKVFALTLALAAAALLAPAASEAAPAAPASTSHAPVVHQPLGKHHTDWWW